MSDMKKAEAVLATGKMEDIILENFLIDGLPKLKKICLEKANKCTRYNYHNLREYVRSDLYTVSKDTIDITDDIQLLSVKSKEYIDRLIKKAIFPANYEKSSYISQIEKLYDDSYFTKEEQDFIALMTEELFSVIYNKGISFQISHCDLIAFNAINSRPFKYTAREIYNAILHGKIHAGDSVMKYVKSYLTYIETAAVLEASRKFDFFFDSNGILKCDLDTNKNILIKNFLNTIFYELTCNTVRMILLLKLNGKYSILISGK